MTSSVGVSRSSGVTEKSCSGLLSLVLICTGGDLDGVAGQNHGPRTCESFTNRCAPVAATRGQHRVPVYRGRQDDVEEVILN